MVNKTNDFLDEDMYAFLESVCSDAKEKFPANFCCDKEEFHFCQAICQKLIALVESGGHSNFRANFDYLVDKMPLRSVTYCFF